MSNTPLWDKRKDACFYNIGNDYNANNFDEMMEQILLKAKSNDYTVEITVTEENSGFSV